MGQAKQIRKRPAKPFIVITVSDRHKPEMNSFIVSDAGKSGLKMPGFQKRVITSRQLCPDFFFRSQCPVFYKIIQFKSAPVGKSLELVSCQRTEALNSDYPIPGGCQAFKQDVAVSVREIIAPCLVKLTGEMHIPLVVNIQKLKGGNEGCFTDVVRTDKMEGPDKFDLAIIIFSRLQ